MSVTTAERPAPSPELTHLRNPEELSEYEREQILEDLGQEAVEDTPVEVMPIVVGEVDLSHNAERAAYAIADRSVEDLKERHEQRFALNPKKIARTIWGFKGTHRKVLNQARQDIVRAGDVNAMDTEFSDEARSRYGDAIFEQFFNGSDEAIDTKAGEQREFFADNHEASVAAKGLYTEFAASDTMTDDEFNRRLQEVRAQMGEQQSETARGEVIIDNYLEAARAMRGRRQHGEAMENVVDGFRLVRGEARSDSRTEIHRTRVDKVLDKYEDSRFGNIIPAQVLATGVSVGAWLATSGAAVAARAVSFVGGGLVIGGVAAAKEHAEITRQRALRSQERFRGKEYVDGTNRERKLSEFEYRQRNVDSILADLHEDSEKLRGGLFDARTIDAALDRLATTKTLKDVSAERGVDLFDHGVSDNPNKHLEDRIAMARSQAEMKVLLAQAIESGDTDALAAFRLDAANLPANAAGYIDTLLETRSAAFQAEYLEDISAKDKAFGKWRRREALKKGAVAGGLSLVAAPLVQEAFSMFSSDSAGLIERAWGAENNLGAHNTMLGGLIPAEQHIGYELSPEQIADIENGGGTVVDTSTLRTETIPGTQSIEEYTAAHPDEFRHFGSVELYTNETWDTPDYNELTGQLTHNPDGTVSPWATATADGSWNESGTLDMVNTQGNPNVLDMALRQPDGSFLHKTFEFGQDVPEPWASMLYKNEDNTWGFKGDGYLAWGQTSGDHLDVAASIRGDGEAITINTTEYVEVRQPSYEVAVPTDFVPPVWFTGNERLGNATRRSPEEVGAPPPVGEREEVGSETPLSPTENNEETEAAPPRQESDTPEAGTPYGASSPEDLHLMEADRSPRLQENPRAKLQLGEELAWHKSLMDRDRSPEYVQDVGDIIANAPELASLDAKTKAIDTILCGAAFEADNIYHTLSLYHEAEQDNKDALEKTAILLHVNWIDSDLSDPEKAPKVQKTLDEIERAKRDFPDLRIVPFQTEYEREKLDAGEYGDRLVNHAAMKMYDVAMMAAKKSIDEGRREPDDDILIIKNDSDSYGMARDYLGRMLRAFEQNPDKDTFSGAIRWGAHRSKDLPGFGVVTQFLELTRIAARRSTVQGYQSSFGVNTAVRLSTFAGVGGIGNYGKEGGSAPDDLAINERINTARNGTAAHDGPYGSTTHRSGDTHDYHQHVPGADIDTNADRMEAVYVKGLPITATWEKAHKNGEMVSRGDGLELGEKEDIRNNPDAVIDRIEHNFSALITHWLVDRKQVTAGLAFMLPGPQHYRINEVDGQQEFAFTAEGRKWMINRLGRNSKGQFDPYGNRKARRLYNDVSATAKIRPRPARPKMVGGVLAHA